MNLVKFVVDILEEILSDWIFLQVVPQSLLGPFFKILSHKQQLCVFEINNTNSQLYWLVLQEKSLSKIFTINIETIHTWNVHKIWLTSKVQPLTCWDRKMPVKHEKNYSLDMREFHKAKVKRETKFRQPSFNLYNKVIIKVIERL